MAMAANKAWRSTGGITIRQGSVVPLGITLLDATVSDKARRIAVNSSIVRRASRPDAPPPPDGPDRPAAPAASRTPRCQNRPTACRPPDVGKATGFTGLWSSSSGFTLYCTSAIASNLRHGVGSSQRHAAYHTPKVRSCQRLFYSPLKHGVSINLPGNKNRKILQKNRRKSVKMFKGAILSHKKYPQTVAKCNGIRHCPRNAVTCFWPSIARAEPWHPRALFHRDANQPINSASAPQCQTHHRQGQMSHR